MASNERNATRYLSPGTCHISRVLGRWLLCDFGCGQYLDSIILDLIMHGLVIDLEYPGCLALVSAGSFKYLCNQLFFSILDTFSDHITEWKVVTVIHL